MYARNKNNRIIVYDLSDRKEPEVLWRNCKVLGENNCMVLSNSVANEVTLVFKAVRIKAWYQLHPLVWLETSAFTPDIQSIL